MRPALNIPNVLFFGTVCRLLSHVSLLFLCVCLLLSVPHEQEACFKLSIGPCVLVLWPETVKFDAPF
jgi:hypothetical protein